MYPGRIAIRPTPESALRSGILHDSGAFPLSASSILYRVVVELGGVHPLIGVARYTVIRSKNYGFESFNREPGASPNI